MTKNWSTEFENRLLSVADYRDFLALFFKKDANWEKPAPLTFQSFANRAGFASKSFLKDVIAGRKRLTPKSYEATVLGLGMNKMWAEYFEALVGIDEVGFQNRIKTQNYFEERLASVKRRLKKKKGDAVFQAESAAVQVFLQPYFPEVYASLGSVESGASFEEIRTRSSLSEQQIHSILTKMVDANLIVKKDKTYFPLAAALDVKEMKSQQVFQLDYFRSLEKAKNRFKYQADSNQSLFLNQTFSVSSKKLSQFKMELSELANNFASEAESSNGDTIAELTLSFTNTLSEKKK